MRSCKLDATDSLTEAGLKKGLLWVAEHLDRFATNIDKVAHRSKAQANELLIKGIQLAQGRNMCQGAAKQDNIALKGTLAGNCLVEEASQFRVVNFQVVEPLANWLQDIKTIDLIGLVGG